MSGTLIDLSRWWAKARKDQPAIITRIDKVTYGELDSWADALAEWLIAEGLEVGDRVTIIATNCMNWFALSQGVLRAGGLLAPLNPRFTVTEAAYMISRYEPKFVFYDEQRKDMARESASAVAGIRFHELNEVVAHRQRKATSKPRDIPHDTQVVIIPTSGSTARPKGVIFSHRTMVNYVTEFMIAEPHTADHGKVILFAPLSTSAGYVVLTQFLAYGATIYADDAFDPERALKWIVDENIKQKWFETNKQYFKDNGRSMEQLFSYSKISHAQRIYGKDILLRKTLTCEDVQDGLSLYKEYGNLQKNDNYLTAMSLYV